ncbi:diguanylate cyclase [Streptomyces sp. TRM43335]|uniref:Diguanylate cyclase n=1 Tax=Streptomyces taklimakanensis TaxID=2569853 RepID=A0A6G2BAM0_9ACTN|nr:GGDEF domain-containing protein [Streptomyces taklimakanensis]MTE19119.1 diguanylate cyclase [Streptomyces taklimakanensis]
MSTARRTAEEHLSSPSCCPEGGHRPPTDDLTGLLVRRAWEIRASQALDLAHRRREPLALLLGDLDRFKSVNDAYGHLAGDAVLRGVAEVLRRVEGALCGRYGGHAGDEFLVLLPGAGVAAATETARLLLRDVREMTVTAPVDRDTTVTLTGQSVSLGLCVRHPGDPAPGGLSDLLLDSDVALRQAKRAGGDRVHLAGTPGPAVTDGGLPVVPRPPRRARPGAPGADRPSWVPYGGMHRAVPAGTWWDAVRMPGPTGRRVLEALLRQGGRPPGPVIADPRGGGDDLDARTGAGARTWPEDRSRVYFLIPPRAADHRGLPGAHVLGRGSYVVVPDAACVRPPGLHWLVPPSPGRRLTGVRALREAMAAVLGGRAEGGDGPPGGPLGTSGRHGSRSHRTPEDSAPTSCAS